MDNDTTTSTDMDADEDMDTTADVTDAEDDIVQSDADDTGPTMTDGTVAAFGLVLRIVEPSGEVQPEEGAAVVLSNDQNGDGAVDSGEQCTTTTDAQGRFSVECGAVTGRRMVLSITAPGASPMYRTVDAQSGAQTQWQVTLREQQPLVCEGDQCALDSGAVIIGNVPDGISAQAWTLGSSATADERPSESIDRSGNLLLPGVTAAVTWLDINGNPLPDLETPVTTWIRYPRAAWGRLDDMDSANSTIDLPLYLLDPLSGRWVRQGMGTLVDVTGSAIDPAALETLQEGNWEGVAFVQAELALSGVWSVQWALETRSCVQGVLNSDAVPVAGALVRLEGLGYDGRTAPALTDAQGSFCIETLRGEQNGEDLDRDGVAGEVYEARLEASVGGNQLFDLGSHMLRSDESACGEGGCLSLGEVGLATNVFEAGTCPVAGLVTDRFGQPVQGTQLHAWSQAELSDATFDELCGDGCTTETTSDENGIFLLNGIPYMGTLTLYANTQEVLATRSRQFSGSLRLEECPTGSVTVVLDQG
ncbi:MAG: carboxypeptidase-like regulatory domain-containing protein [Myxococcota bacterium]